MHATTQPEQRSRLLRTATAAAAQAGISLALLLGPDTIAQAAMTSADVLAAARPQDWRDLDPDTTLLMDLGHAAPVVIELAPDFAPQHVANVLRLARAGYFDAVDITRSQDNYVVQWGDAERAADFVDAQRALPAEYHRPLDAAPATTALPDTDTYAPQVGFAAGLPVAWDTERGEMWLAHCYGMLGVGRDNPPDTGSGAELYVVTGHAPRHLDRNIALIGRVLRGMEQLSSLPRGSGPLGFYEKPQRRLPIRSVTVVADLPADRRPRLEVLRTDTETWQAWVAARRSRQEPWFVEPTGRLELCNVPIPVR